MNSRGADPGCTVRFPRRWRGMGSVGTSTRRSWVSRAGCRPPDHTADVLTEDDLEHVPSGAQLASRYRLIVYPWHSEYVTAHEILFYSRCPTSGKSRVLVGEQFLSSGRSPRRRSHAHSHARRDLGRPEAALVGEEYLDWFQDEYPNQPYLVTDVGMAPWLFAGTGLHDGSRFGVYGIEIDAPTPQSPPDTRVLARIPDIFGLESADMTYYTTLRGARVFPTPVRSTSGRPQCGRPRGSCSTTCGHTSRRLDAYLVAASARQ